MKHRRTGLPRRTAVVARPPHRPLPSGVSGGVGGVAVTVTFFHQVELGAGLRALAAHDDLVSVG